MEYLYRVRDSKGRTAGCFTADPNSEEWLTELYAMPANGSMWVYVNFEWQLVVDNTPADGPL